MILPPSTPAHIPLARPLTPVLLHRCVDSDDLHFKAFRTVLLKSLPSLNDGAPITRAFYDAEMSGRQNREIMSDLGASLPLASQTAVWEEKERIYASMLDAGAQPLPGLVAFMDALDKAGTPFCLVTNAPRVMAEYTLKALGLTERFGERVVIAEECDRYKPAPDPYLKGLELLGVEAGRAVAFEDSPSGTQSAVAAGIFTVGVMSSREEGDLQKAGASVCVEDYEDAKLWEMVKARGLARAAIEAAKGEKVGMKKEGS